MEAVAEAEEVEILKVDVLTDIDDPQELPWPYESNSVNEITCTGVLEYIPGKLRGAFMDEIYRVLVPEGKCTIITRYWNSSMAYVDFNFEWPPLAEQSFLVFNKEWRERWETENKRSLGITCSFDFTYGFGWDAETATRSAETQAFQVKHYSNAAEALQVILTKRA